MLNFQVVFNGFFLNTFFFYKPPSMENPVRESQNPHFCGDFLCFFPPAGEEQQKAKEKCLPNRRKLFENWSLAWPPKKDVGKHFTPTFWYLFSSPAICGEKFQAPQPKGVGREILKPQPIHPELARSKLLRILRMPFSWRDICENSVDSWVLGFIR